MNKISFKEEPQFPLNLVSKLSLDLGSNTYHQYSNNESISITSPLQSKKLNDQSVKEKLQNLVSRIKNLEESTEERKTYEEKYLKVRKILK